MVVAMQTDNLAQTVAFFLLLLILVLAITVYMFSKQQSLVRSMYTPTKRRVYTIVECGGSRQVREFQPGDYVGRPLGSCGESVEAWIVGIYAEEDKQQIQQKPGLNPSS